MRNTVKQDQEHTVMRDERTRREREGREVGGSWGRVEFFL